MIFVVADTLRSDRASCYGYDRETTPNLDAFAEQATVYRDPVAQAPWSIPSHASLFTGKYPHEHGATTVSPVLRAEETLPALLREHGYRTCGVSTNEYVRPVTGFARGFDEFHTPWRATVPDGLVDTLGRGINAVASSPRLRRPVEAAFNVTRRFGGEPTGTSTPLGPAERFLSSAPEPLFLFVNVIDVHLPRSPADRFRERFVDPELADVDIPADERQFNFRNGTLSARQRRKLSQLYDADVATMDAKLGRLFDTLRAEGHLEDSLVVVVSDHGENLGEFGFIGHQHSVYDSVMSVPMVVSYPGQTTAREVDHQVEIRRLFHTVLDVAGVREYPEMSLESVAESRPSYGEFYTPMVDLIELERRRRVVYDASLLGRTLSFVRDDGYKLIRNLGEEFLYRTPERPDWETRPERHQPIYERLRSRFPDAITAAEPTPGRGVATR